MPVLKCPRSISPVTSANITEKVLPFNPVRAAKVMFSKWIQTILVIISILFTAASTVNTPLINSKKVSSTMYSLHPSSAMIPIERARPGRPLSKIAHVL